MHPFDKVTYISLRQCNVSKKELFLNLTVSNDEFTFTSNINGLQDICKNTVENETNNIDIDQVCNIGVKLAKALFVLFEKNVFTHTAKCLILENVCDSVEERYWALYESSHKCWRQGECQDESEKDSDESESNREMSDHMEDVSESGEEVVQE
ncbi:unnamed protein product [Mytilus edulis]|uniref:Uncharacterized protein n=1 Tax=Mytilus edulis TaxID=6550 RepID=A0A8S3SJQ6_MYTED|nr:unnamed protein product [Mytilus edulis]